MEYVKKHLNEELDRLLKLLSPKLSEIYLKENELKQAQEALKPVQEQVDEVKLALIDLYGPDVLKELTEKDVCKQVDDALRDIDYTSGESVAEQIWPKQESKKVFTDLTEALKYADKEACRRLPGEKEDLRTQFCLFYDILEKECFVNPTAIK